jgi:hypothetical protein
VLDLYKIGFKQESDGMRPTDYTRQFQREILIADTTGAKRCATVCCEERDWIEGRVRRRECSVVLRSQGLEINGVGHDFFKAFCQVREQLSACGIYPLCYGASRNVYPSGLTRDWSAGDMAYRLDMGREVCQQDMVHIFATGPDVEVATVAAQRAFFEAWLKPRPKQPPKNV